MNLVPNGDFELGNTGFGSDYVLSASNGDEDQYAVLSSPFPWNGLFIATGDHTTGTGLMFVGNGSPDTTDRVWFSNSIAVTPHTDYFFEAFVMNVVNGVAYPPGTDPATFSKLSFYANGEFLGTRTTDLLGVWQGLSTVWNSGASTTVDLKILNANAISSGNDFAIDDIFLGVESIVTPPSVPEPATLALWGIGCLGCAMGAYRRRRAS